MHNKHFIMYTLQHDEMRVKKYAAKDRTQQTNKSNIVSHNL